MRLDSLRINVTTDESGDGNDTADRAVLGRLVAVELIDGDYADGVDATITVVNTNSGVNKTLLTATNFNTDQTLYPRHVAHDEAGAAQTYNGTQEVHVKPIIDGLLKLTIASGGNAKTGGVIVYYEPGR